MATTTYRQSLAETLPYTRKVYFWLCVGLLLCSGAAYAALNFGAPVDVPYKDSVQHVPPMVALVVRHPYVTVLGFLALGFISMGCRKVQGLSSVTFFAFTSFSGLFIGPSLYYAEMQARTGHTLSAHPIRDAFVLTAGAFAAMTLYAFTTKRDLTPLGPFLYAGIWVLLGALILRFFFDGQVYSLAVSSVAVILFSLYIAYDTCRIVYRRERDDAIGDALALFLDLINLFLHLLNNTGSKSD